MLIALKYNMSQPMLTQTYNRLKNMKCVQIIIIRIYLIILINLDYQYNYQYV